ncbi:MAG: CBS domain-containing protein [Methanomicrobia archaeon]|nr:CBS domain-containing protein [Methanomicrobia archaeon]MCK4636320.1 CBS domain-containing protein [Methanomicrobia archaeon]
MLSPEDTVAKAAREMSGKDMGCAVIVENSKPIGVVTERDIVKRVISKGKKPSEVKLKSIMSSPVITIDYDSTILGASKVISEQNVRRLVVTKNEAIVGIVTSIDLLNYAPEIFEERIEEREIGPGACEVCGQHFQNLNEVNGKYVCDNCKKIVEG